MKGNVTAHMEPFLRYLVRRLYRRAINMEDFISIVRFIVTSDIHYKKESIKETERFEKGMRLAYEYARSSAYQGVDAFFAVGDFANSGSEWEYNRFKESLDKCIEPETIKVLTTASHEFRDGGVQASYDKLERIFYQKPDIAIEIKGFRFIAVSMEDKNSIGEEKKKWIEGELLKASADDYRKPIFFFQHPHLSDTVYGSINWGEDDIISILMNYPQIIDFSGHSHAPINDPRSIHQQHFTSCGTGSFTYFELDEFDKIYGTIPPDANNCAQFLIVEADDRNRVRILPYDVLSESFFPYVWKIDTPSNPESFIYTDERYKTEVRPYFDENQTIDINKAEDGVVFSFKQAHIDEDYIDDYLIRIRRKRDGAVVKQLCIWSSYYIQPMPEYVSCKVDNLPTGEYNAEVYARGFWRNSSVNKLTTDFIV